MRGSPDRVQSEISHHMYTQPAQQVTSCQRLNSLKCVCFQPFNCVLDLSSSFSHAFKYVGTLVEHYKQLHESMFMIQVSSQQQQWWCFVTGSNFLISLGVPLCSKTLYQMKSIKLMHASSVIFLIAYNVSLRPHDCHAFCTDGSTSDFCFVKVNVL